MIKEKYKIIQNTIIIFGHRLNRTNEKKRNFRK